LAISPLAAANPYSTAIILSASGLPAGATASFAPASVTPGAASAASVMTVTIPALVGRNRSPLGGSPQVLMAALLLSLGLLGGKRTRRRLSAVRPFLWVLLLGALGVSLSGCGNDTGFAIPQTTSTITVTGTSGALVHSTTVTLTLK
jgi:hypothetical protein